jgi:ribosomal-protein-alanine N-acetyltransferase
MIVRKAGIKDVDGIYQIELDSFSIPWSKDAILHELKNTDLTMYYVLEDHGIVQGYGGLWAVVDEGQITNIAIAPACRGKGYGELLVRVLLEEAWNRDIAEVYLEVRFSNLAAQHLYRKLGFTVLSVRKEYYSEPTEDAYVMACTRENYTWIESASGGKS